MVGGRFNQRGLFIQQTADAGTLYTGVTGGLPSTLLSTYTIILYSILWYMYCTVLHLRQENFPPSYKFDYMIFTKHPMDYAFLESWGKIKFIVPNTMITIKYIFTLHLK